MSKLGFSSKTIHDLVHEETVPHDHVPGRAYEVADPSQKLVHLIGGGFFNEPRYYDPNRSYAAFMVELLATGKIASKIVDEQGLTAQAHEVIEAAAAVANSENPEDLLIIASWARDPREGLRLRTTPQILLAVAAAHPGTREFVTRYGTAILRRADEIRQVFAAFRHLFQGKDGRHKGSLPHGLRKAMAAALAEATPYELLKYDGSDRPTFADVLKMVGGSRKLKKFGSGSGWPLSKPMFQYLVNGVVTDDAPEILQKRRAFFRETDVPAVTTADIEAAGLTWENVVSHFGPSREVWERVIPVMAEMALTRNLRNFEQAGIGPESWAQVEASLLRDGDSVQLPFRFFSAAREVETEAARRVVGLALDRSCARLPDLPGVTVALADNSGSAVGCAVSGRGSLRVADAGNMLEAVLARRLGSRAVIGVFGDVGIWVPFSPEDDCLAIKARIDAVAQTEDRRAHKALGIPDFVIGKAWGGTQGVGQSTETGLWFLLKDLIDRKVHADRIVLLSDLCCYTQGDVNCGYDLKKYMGSSKATIQSLVDLYRLRVNKELKVYSINLAGYRQSQVRPEGEGAHLLSGWSEKLFGLIRELEGAGEHREAPVPAIEVLRAKYRRSR
jgi:hypothetical protein